MATKNTEVLDKKTLEKYRKEIKEDFEKNYKDEIVKELSDKVSEEVTNRFNAEYRNQLIDEVSTDVKEEVKYRIEREEKKIYRHKSFKIFRLSVYILVLLGIIGYVAYRLYITDNVDLVRYDYEPPKTTQVAKPSDEENKKEEPQIDYKALYGGLLDDFKIYDYSLYKDFHKASDLTMVQKLQIAYSKLSDADIVVDGSIISIKSSVLRDNYIRLFGTDDYEPTSFNIYNLNFAYSATKNEYIGIVYTDNVEDVAYEVFDAGVEQDIIYVKAYAARLNNGKVYNLKNGRMVGNATDKLSDYGNKLSTITIRFNKDKNFVSITNE